MGNNLTLQPSVRWVKEVDGQEREKRQKIYEAWKNLLAQNPLFGYQPHPKQQRFHASQRQIKAFLGGNRSGKTTAGILDDIIQAVDPDALPDHLRPYKKFEPPFHGRLVTPSFDIMEGVIFQKFREWTPRDQLNGGSFEQAYEKSRRILKFANGSWFDFLTFEQDLDKFGGTAKHRIHYDEEPPREIRQEGRMRLLDYEGADELFTMTPLEGMSWMYDEIWEPWNKNELDDAILVLVDMDENPHLSEDQKKKLLKGLSREEREARKEGRPVSFSGLIYPEFSKRRHVIPEIEKIPDHCRVYVGIDPGTRLMAAVVWLYMEPDGHMIVFDELGVQDFSIAQVCQAIHRNNLRWQTRPAWYVIDPAAKNVMHQTGRSDQMEYADGGIVTIAGQNAVPAGIHRVKARLQNDKLQICANCEILIEEFTRYHWVKKKRTEDEAPSKPVKAKDHCLDALRYVVMSRPYSEHVDEAPKLYDPLEAMMKEELEGFKRTKIPQTKEGGIFA